MSTPSLTLVRQYKAPASRLFAAFTRAEDLLAWFVPPDMKALACESDPRPGGIYRIAMQGESGQFIVSGEYREFDAPHKLVYSWQWEGTAGVSQVTITLRSIDAETTELTLLHEQLPTAEVRRQHDQGWAECFARLEAFVAEELAA